MNDNVTVTIGATQLWIAAKLVSAFFITKKELQYPIWKDGIQVPRRFHQVVRAYLRNAAFNPEWGILKLVSFLPVYIFSGKKYIYKFLPWKVATPPPFCTKCNDKGQYYEESFLAGAKGNWIKCECQGSNPAIRPDVACVVCLDKGFVGPKRPCGHCKRRGEQLGVGDCHNEPDEMISDVTITMKKGEQPVYEWKTTGGNAPGRKAGHTAAYNEHVNLISRNVMKPKDKKNEYDMGPS